MNAKSVSQVCALILLAANVALAAPVTYYVKNGGLDSKDGTSDTNAWATISRVHTAFAADDIGPGDSVLFKCGSQWAEQLIVSKSGNTQVPGGVITIGAYGSGDRPIIGYDLDFTGVAWTQYQATNAYWTFAPDQVYIANELLPSNQLGEAAGYFRVYHQASDENDCAVTAGSFYWDNGSPAKLYIHAFDDSNPNSTLKRFYANTTGRSINPRDETDMEVLGAIRTNGQSYIVFQNIHAVNQAYGIGGKETDHITIDNCRLSGNSNGTKFGHQQSYPHSTYLLVHDTDVRYNANGLRYGWSENITIYDNQIAHHFVKVGGEDREGISFFNCDDADVYGNEFWENHVGLIADAGPNVSRNFYFHHNYFHGNIERCIVLGGIGKFDDDVHVYHNVMWLPTTTFTDPGTGSTANPQGIWLMAETVSTANPYRVYNNTIHAQYGLYMKKPIISISLDLKNNIFDECEWHIQDLDATVNDPANHIRDYNSFDQISQNPTHKIQWKGIAYTDWNTYRNIGPGGRNLELNGNLGDPGFINAPVNVRVQGPLEDAGECPAGGVPFDCNTALDFYGQAIGGAVSIGAAEPPPV